MSPQPYSLGTITISNRKGAKLWVDSYCLDVDCILRTMDELSALNGLHFSLSSLETAIDNTDLAAGRELRRTLRPKRMNPLSLGYVRWEDMPDGTRRKVRIAGPSDGDDQYFGHSHSGQQVFFYLKVDYRIRFHRTEIRQRGRVLRRRVSILRGAGIVWLRDQAKVLVRDAVRRINREELDVARLYSDDPRTRFLKLDGRPISDQIFHLMTRLNYAWPKIKPYIRKLSGLKVHVVEVGAWDSTRPLCGQNGASFADLLCEAGYNPNRFLERIYADPLLRAAYDGAFPMGDVTIQEYDPVTRVYCVVPEDIQGESIPERNTYYRPTLCPEYRTQDDANGVVSNV